MQRTSPHDPYRPADPLGVPQFDGDPSGTEPVAGPVRILAVVDRYPPWINAGAEWMLHSMLRRLAEFGHDCMVATALPDDAQIPVRVDGVSVYPIGMADQLATVADVLVGHLLWTREVVEIARQHRLPLLYLLHNDRQVSHWNLAARNVTVLVPNSEWVAKRAVEDGWSGPMVVCRPPVFCADYEQRLTPPPEREFAATLVNMIPEKGVQVFYDLARQFHRKRFLGVIGAYGHQHRPPRGVDNVTLIQPTSNMRDDVYAKSRVVIMPSSYESWGRVAVEAMAAGVPVLAHPTDGLVEACGDGALYVDREDSKAWAAALTLLDDTKVRRLQVRRGKARAAALERMTDADLVTFDEWVRRCAALAPEPTGSRPVSPSKAEAASGTVETAGSVPVR